MVGCQDAIRDEMYSCVTLQDPLMILAHSHKPGEPADQDPDAFS